MRERMKFLAFINLAYTINIYSFYEETFLWHLNDFIERNYSVYRRNMLM